MSVRRDLIEIKCDGPDDETACPDSLAWTDYGTAADLRLRMTKDGWLTGLRGGIDRCEKCMRQAAGVSAPNASGDQP